MLNHEPTPRPSAELPATASACPRCGRSLADGIYEVHSGVTEWASLALADWGWEKHWADADDDGEIWYACGGCETRLPTDCEGWIRERM